MKYFICLLLLFSFNLFSSENKHILPKMQVANFLPSEKVVKAVETSRTLDKQEFWDEFYTVILWTVDVSYKVVLEDNSTVNVRGRWKNSYYYHEAPDSIMGVYNDLYIQPGDAIRKTGFTWEKVYDKHGSPSWIQVPNYTLYRDGEEIIEFTLEGYFWS